MPLWIENILRGRTSTFNIICAGAIFTFCTCNVILVIAYVAHPSTNSADSATKAMEAMERLIFGLIGALTMKNRIENKEKE